MTAYDAEFVCPSDSRDDLREEIAFYLDQGALKPGSSIERLRHTLAPYASGRPGLRTVRELGLDLETSPDWLDAVNAIERRLRGPKKIEQAEVLIDCGRSDPGRPEWRQAKQAAPVEEQPAAETASAPTTKEAWAAKIRGEA